ncbi:MAG: hypothetical protein HZB26_22890 [Candidatus Hydrogenedentes bacterium]|nr:hypothetical protein [Candidatus Hydrogenedentota bacterium]
MSAAVNTDDLSDEDKVFVRWFGSEKPIESSNCAQFGAVDVARRIARIIGQSHPVTVGLFGPFGSGKSSVINLAISAAARPDRSRLLLCRIEAWGVRENSAVSYILRSAVTCISKYVDCIALSTIPAEYKSVLTGSGSLWGRIVAAMLDKEESPREVLGELDFVLSSVGRRLLIIIEDVDRCHEPDRLVNEVAPLLDQLKDLRCVSFIFAANIEHTAVDKLVRLLEHIELVPRPTQNETIDLMIQFRAVLHRARSHVDVLSEEERDKRFLGSARYDISSLLGREGDDPVHHVERLLTTPRRIKSVFRRTWNAWQVLHGEVDRDELLVIHVLREAAYEAYGFVHANIKRLRSVSLRSPELAKEKQEQLDGLRREFKERLPTAKSDVEAATWGLIVFLFPGLAPTWSAERRSAQRIEDSEPTDYWERTHAEAIADGEIRDQTIIEAIRRWKEERSGRVLDGYSLAEAMLFKYEEGFAAKVEQFGAALDAEQVRLLAGELFDLILSRKGCRNRPSSRGDENEYPGFIELWRLSLRKQFPNHEEWLIGQIRKALETDLRLALDMYHYWRFESENEVKGKAKHPGIRTALVRATQDAYANKPEALAEVIDSKYMYSLGHLVLLYSTRREGGDGFSFEEWAWLGPVLLAATELAPNTMVPQVVGLLYSNVREVILDTFNPDAEPKSRITHEFDEELAVGLFGTGLSKIMKTIAQPFDETALDDEQKARVENARRHAQGWMAKKEQE